MSDDLVAWLRAQLDDDEQAADAIENASYMHGVESDAEAEILRFADTDRIRREVDAKRETLTEHAPQLRTVEWDHDQNGKGEALCCPRCQNAEHSEWNPPLGQARGLPDGFVTPYVLAPCRTLRLLALPYADWPGYRAEWWP